MSDPLVVERDAVWAAIANRDKHWKHATPEETYALNASVNTALAAFEAHG